MAAQRSFCVLVAIAALACGSDPKPPPVAPMPVAEPLPPPPPPPEPPPQKPGDDPRQSVINVSDEIMVACGITEAVNASTGRARVVGAARSFASVSTPLIPGK